MANSKGLIPADVINEIKSKNDIVNYISSKQELFKRGKNYHGKCPVCGKLESFVVYPETNSFYCFACSLGGDIITYVMKTKNVDYKAAVCGTLFCLPRLFKGCIRFFGCGVVVVLDL